MVEGHFGPSDRSRTCGLLNPIQALYQTEPHPDNLYNADYYITKKIKNQGVNQKKSVNIQNTDRPLKFNPQNQILLIQLMQKLRPLHLHRLL